MNSFLLIDTLDKLKDLSDKWKEREFAIDTEFTDLSYYKQDLIGISMYTDNHNIPAVFIQFNFKDKYTQKEKNPNGGRAKIDVEYIFEKTDAIDKQEAIPYLKKMLEGANCVTANGKVEIKALNKLGIKINIIDDVNMMNHLLDVSTKSDLKSAGRKYLNLDMKSYEDTVGMKVGNINWNKVDWYAYAEYGAKDSWVTWKLRDVFRKQIEEDEALMNCYTRLELPLISRVADSEMAGVYIDKSVLEEMSERIAKDIKSAEEDIFNEVGVEFNLGSPKQLGEILFDRLGLPVVKETDSGGRSTGEDAMKELAFMGYEIAEKILDYRRLSKLQTTYIDKIPDMVDEDGRLRGSFNQNGTETGRFSSSNPNLQNIVNDKKYPVKRSFVAQKGYSLIVADWSTVEIRIMAHESKDPVMTKILKEGRDVHQETADNISAQTGLHLSRSIGKTLNFAILYGMGASSLAYTLNKSMRGEVKKGTMTQEDYEVNQVSERTAQKMIDGFYSAYYGFTEWGKKEVQNSKNTGWVYTLGGRRRPLPDLKNKKTYSSGTRKCINTIIQGGAGDLMKLAIIKLSDMYKEKGYDAKTLLYVHDEIVVEVREDQSEECLKDVMWVMENIFPACDVPIKCEGDIFSSWDGLKGGEPPKDVKSTNNRNLYSFLRLNNLIK